MQPSSRTVPSQPPWDALIQFTLSNVVIVGIELVHLVSAAVSTGALVARRDPNLLSPSGGI